MMISIITATYNSADTVKDTLDSVLRQTYQDYELIIKDGQSTDDTLQICHEYEPRFGGKMHIVSCADRGIYDAMNMGVEMASGEVVGLLNSDDFFTRDDVLQSVADAFSNDYELEAVYGDIHYVKPDKIREVVRYYSSKPFRPWMMRLGFMPAHPSFYCKKTSYDRFAISEGSNIMFYDPSYKIAADFEFLLRMIYVGRIKCAYINMDFVTMRTGGASSSGIKSHLQINREHMRAFKQNHVYSNIFLLMLRYVCKLWDVAVIKKLYLI